MKQLLHFDDVLISPQFSFIKDRTSESINISTKVAGEELKLPIISSNMDSVTGSEMAHAMFEAGGRGCLHRFQSIEDNVKMYKESPEDTWVSFGLGIKELDRAFALWNVGASTFVLDVAHGASIEVVKQVKEFNKKMIGSKIIVGNFANARSINDFIYHLGNEPYFVDAFKVGIGSGGNCSTQKVTGHCSPILSSVLDCVTTNRDIICDGGIRNSGDLVKALAAGAKAVMMGRILAGTEESLGEVNWNREGEYLLEPAYKKYRGSASKESYELQRKTAAHRTPEGETTMVPYTGTVAETLQPFVAGLRSGMSYSGVSSLPELKERAEFIQLTHAGFIASGVQK